MHLDALPIDGDDVAGPEPLGGHKLPVLHDHSIPNLERARVIERMLFDFHAHVECGRRRVGLAEKTFLDLVD